jgi:eukaryotic-like serine/threonine-protein kinase
MATVYLARLSGAGGFQRFVAIKRLHPHLAKDQEFIQMFLDEARLAARLHHPNVVPILEIGESVDGYYLVMEYIEGDTLARLLARSAQSGKPLPTKAGIRVCLDTLAGLHAAHELTDDDGKPLNIVHRDVSPQNILIGIDGSSKITDFGVARASTRLSTTRTGQLKGKLAYMAPEQARGKDVDRRADVFAMGIVVWETLAQRRLFKGEGEADTLNRVLYEPIPLLRSACPTMPQMLEDICSKALEREPEKRFESCAEFGDALEKVARASGVLGSPKDVAAHLTAVMGTDISQQREAVRAWITRSEPSRPHDPRIDRPVPKEDSGKTSQPSEPSAATSPPGVSSVSSAAMELPPGFGQPPVPMAPAPAPKPKSRAWIPISLLGVVVLGAASFYMLKVRGSDAAAVPDRTPPVASVAAPTPIPSTTVAPPTIDTAPAPPVSVAVAPSAKPTTTTKPIVRTGVGKPPGGHPPTTAAPTAPTQTAGPANTAPKDDISNNPYR